MKLIDYLKTYFQSDSKKINTLLDYDLKKHSVSKRLDYMGAIENNDHDQVIDILVRDFCNRVADSMSSTGVFRLYRGLILPHIDELDVYEIGLYFSTKKEMAISYDGVKSDYSESIVLTTYFNADEIDWMTSFELYLISDFKECEIRVLKSSQDISNKTFHIEFKES